MLAIDDEKLPPPTPAVAAHKNSTQSCTLCDWSNSHPLGTTMASSSVGISNKVALKVVHALPPNLGTANVYGMRSSEPIRFGMSVNKNSSDTDKLMPALARLSTTIVHSTHTLKPRCSANIDHARFFRAILPPARSQKTSSSGSQCSIHRPRRL